MDKELKKGSIDIDFPGKEKDEEVKMLIRKHTFILIKQNLIYLIYFLIPVIVYFLGKTFFVFILSFPIYPIFILFISLFYTFFVLFLMVEWVDFYYDAWIITNKRLIDVEQTGLFKRTVSEMRLEKIQDVSFELKGVFAALMHYGTISIQTAGSTSKFELTSVKNPDTIKVAILRLYDERIKELNTPQVAPNTIPLPTYQPQPTPAPQPQPEQIPFQQQSQIQTEPIPTPTQPEPTTPVETPAPPTTTQSTQDFPQPPEDPNQQ